MIPKIKKIQYEREYIYNIQFENNRKGNINFQPFLWGEVFEPLKEKKFFRKAFINQTSGTITWPNGADIAPETIYKKILSNA
ncbi:DUF2442 domain-containing protein [Candidatus Gottesmanbacteria bacterium]|nr:DUF2442 domain-containing protein [Candidatus Gottesmanbacteria bacterium]MBM3713650.1 DUF2442 domain-containing protein [Actinomycetota bacterium]